MSQNGADRVIKSCGVTAAVGACVVTLAACGSSGNGQPARTSGSGASSTPAAQSSGSSTQGEASKSAKQILADAAGALKTARGYVLQGTLTDQGRPVRLKVVAASAKSLELALSGGGANAELIALPNADYVRANAAFWRPRVGQHATTLANHWIEIPPAGAQGMTASLGRFAPGTLARCLAEDHGSLSVAGKTMVDGRPAVVLKDAGNAPGSAPGTLAVATSGPPYPLRATATGGQRAGGRVDVCNDGKAGNTHGTLTISHFGAVPPIKAPQHAIKAGQTSA
jgi:hypothetical protein